MTEKQKSFIGKEGSGWVPAIYTLPLNEDGTSAAFPTGNKGDRVPVLLRKCHRNPNRKVRGKAVCDVLAENGRIAEVFRANVEAAL